MEIKKRILIKNIEELISSCDKEINGYFENNNIQLINIRNFLKCILREIKQNNAILRNHNYAHATFIFEMYCQNKFKSLAESYEKRGTNIKNIKKIKNIYYYNW